MRQLEERILKLERLLGRKTLDVEILKEARAAPRAKKAAVALADAACGRTPLPRPADLQPGGVAGRQRQLKMLQGLGGYQPKRFYVSKLTTGARTLSLVASTSDLRDTPLLRPPARGRNFVPLPAWAKAISAIASDSRYLLKVGL